MTRADPSQLSHFGPAGSVPRTAGRAPGSCPTRAAPAKLVVRAVADEVALARLDARAPAPSAGRSPARASSARSRTRRSRRRRGRRARSPATPPAPPPSRREIRPSRQPAAPERRRASSRRPSRSRRTRRPNSWRRGDVPGDVLVRDAERPVDLGERPRLRGAVARLPAARRTPRARRRRGPQARRSASAASSSRPLDERVPEVEDHRAHSRSTSQATCDVVFLRARVADREPDHALGREASWSRRRSRPVAVAARASSSLSSERVPEAHRREEPRRRTAPSRARRRPSPRSSAASRRARGSAPAGRRGRSSAAPSRASARGSGGRARARSRASRARRRSERGSRRGPRTPPAAHRGGASRASSSPCGVNSHLCGLTTSESARSTPSRHQRSSGQTAAAPA